MKEADDLNQNLLCEELLDFSSSNEELMIDSQNSLEDFSNIKYEIDKIVEKWSKTHFLNDLSEQDRTTLSVLLDNCDNYCDRCGFCDKNNLLSLMKESWLKCSLRKCVAIQPAISAASLCFFYNKSNIFDAIGVPILAFGFEC